MQKNPKRARALELLIQKECTLYAEYLAVLESERKSLTAFRTEEVLKSSAKRDALLEEMKRFQAERLELIKDLPDAAKRRLTDVVTEHLHVDERRILLPLVERLKKAVVQVRKAELEFKQILNFSMNLVCSTASLLTSGNQAVSKGYTRMGSAREQYSPAGFTVPTLKQA